MGFWLWFVTMVVWGLFCGFVIVGLVCCGFGGLMDMFYFWVGWCWSVNF